MEDCRMKMNFTHDIFISHVKLKQSTYEIFSCAKSPVKFFVKKIIILNLQTEICRVRKIILVLTKGLFTRATLCLAIDILEYMFN